MDEITIYLEKTNKVQFCKWLSVYCRKKQAENRSYPYQDGWRYNFYYPFDISPDFQIQLGITANFVRIVEANEAEEKYTTEDWNLENAVSVSWLEIGERVKVTLTHKSGKWTFYPLFVMLAEIGQDWQETRRDIWKYVQEQASKYHIELTGQPFPIETETAQPVSRIEDPQAGTITTWLNEEGQEIIGGTANPGQTRKLLDSLSALKYQGTDEETPAYQVTQTTAQDRAEHIPLSGLAGTGYENLLNSTGIVDNPLNGLNSTGKLALEIGRRALEASEKEAARAGEAIMPEKPKQKGRYRLTKEEIKQRKKIVKEAERIYREANPKKTWEQIAYELDMSERTLRDWRHNPLYS